MKFEPGHFYQHEGGRRIRIANEIVNTVVWGPTLIIEAYDEVGYEPSFAGISGMPEDLELQWTEIGEQEYYSNFIYVPCEGCGKYIEKGQAWARTDEGIYHLGPQPHPNCYNETMEGYKAPHEIKVVGEIPQ